MKILVGRTLSGNQASDLLVLFVKPNQRQFPTFVPKQLKKFIRLSTFSGKTEEKFLFLFPDDPIRRILVIGCGESKLQHKENHRRAGHEIAALLEKSDGDTCHIYLQDPPGGWRQTIEGLIEGILLSQYENNSYKTDKKKTVHRWDKLYLLCDSESEQKSLRRIVRQTVFVCEGMNYCRQLCDMPANILTPRKMASESRKLFSAETRFKVSVFDEKKIRALGMEAFYSVGRGSVHPPRLILIEYKARRKNTATLAVVGKGVTFDSGGISIKPSRGMDEMKFDMAGAAAVIGFMRTVKNLNPELNIIAAIPCAENMPGGDASRPGDVVRAYNGKTIEIIDTDAEGRMLLADTLSYVEKKYHPDWIVDLATLTGAISVTLGSEASGIFGSDDVLLEMIEQAAEESGDRVWRLPMWQEYAEQLQSETADLKHVGTRGGGSSITAAKFLEAFIDKTPWVHIDIAGTAYNVVQKKYLGKGASGVGVRLLFKLLERLVV